MKKLLFAIALFAGVFTTKAQVFSGTSEIEKANKEGLYTSTAVDDKYVKQAWQLELAKYGKVETGKGGAYKVNGANIPTISGDPIMLTSKISTSKGVPSDISQSKYPEDDFDDARHSTDYHATSGRLRDKKHQNIDC